MRKMPILLSFILFAGCSTNNTKVSSPVDSVSVDSTKKTVMIDSAKTLLDSANFYMAKGVKKELSLEITRKKVGFFMQNFQRIYQKLPPSDTTIVYEYRIEGVNKLIDLQVEQTKKEGQ